MNSEPHGTDVPAWDYETVALDRCQIRDEPGFYSAGDRLIILRAFAAEPEKEWLSDEERGKQIFQRKVVLPPSALPQMVAALDTFGNGNPSPIAELKKKLQATPAKLTIMDIAALSNIEKKELAWFYDLLTTNHDPVITFFGFAIIYSGATRGCTKSSKRCRC